MRLRITVRILTFLFTVAAPCASAMNNDDVVKMVRAEIAEDTIAVAVESANPAEFNVSADALIALKDNGVSQRLIQAMVKRQSATSTSAESGGTQVNVSVHTGGDNEPARKRITFTAAPDKEVLPPDAVISVGKEYFTRHNFKFEDGEHSATNYWRGGLVPLNTKVQVVKVSRKKLTLKVLNTGETIVVENVPDYTRRTIDQIAQRMLAEQPVAIEKYGEEMASAIKAGTPRLGMTKTQVLLTRGYPPGHETPSLDGSQWKYWSSRFIVHTFVFDGDTLAEGRGLD